jgi:lambda repressor-like predicted transcriptional regulator
MNMQERGSTLAIKIREYGVETSSLREKMAVTWREQ